MQQKPLDPEDSKSVYPFVQQFDSNCHIAPFVNLHYLTKMREKSKAMGRPVDLSEFTWLSNQGWFPVLYNHSKIWQEAIQSLIINQSGEYYKYNQDNLENGITLGKIYDEYGNKFGEYHWNSIDSWNPITNKLISGITPHTTMQAKYLTDKQQETLNENAYTSLPIFYKNGSLFYQESEEKTIILEPTKPNQIQKDSKQIWFSLPEKGQLYDVPIQILEQLNLPENAIIMPYIPSGEYAKKLDVEQIYRYCYLPQSQEQTFFMTSLYDLILFTMGVDRNNNIINQEHRLYPAYQEMHNAMKKSGNPWNLPDFNKEKLFEYHLANLFKANSKLAELANNVVNIHLPGMELYDRLDALYDSTDPTSRKSLKDKKEYLPGKEQILAFYFAETLRSVWAAAKNPPALQAVLDVEADSYSTTLLWAAAQVGLSPAATDKQLISAATTKHGDYSFLETWEIIKKELLEKLKDNIDLVSWSGHGYVMSFAEDLNYIQSASVTDPDVMKKLGFTVIDSLYDTAINPFYRRTAGERNQGKPTNLMITADGSLPHEKSLSSGQSKSAKLK